MSAQGTAIRETAEYVVARLQALGFETQVIDKPGIADGKDFVIRGIAGRHAELAGGSTGYGNIIFVVETGGLRFCHLGDNGPVTEELRLAIGVAGPRQALQVGS